MDAGFCVNHHHLTTSNEHFGRDNQLCSWTGMGPGPLELYTKSETVGEKQENQDCLGLRIPVITFGFGVVYFVLGHFCFKSGWVSSGDWECENSFLKLEESNGREFGTVSSACFQSLPVVLFSWKNTVLEMNQRRIKCRVLKEDF